MSREPSDVRGSAVAAPRRSSASWHLMSVLCVLLWSACDEPSAPDDGGGPDAAALDGGPQRCASAADCDDVTYCNGQEACDPTNAAADARGCVPGATPCLAGQTCDEASAACQSLCDLGGDADGDGHVSIDCGGDDCDDSDSNRYPDNAEVCDADDHDEDCDAMTFGTRDVDGDEHIDAECCNVGADGQARCGGDCDDARGGVHPGLPEVCDELDNDCDELVDEGVVPTFYVDADGDGHGSDAAGADTVVDQCFGPDGYSDTADDCDDSASGSAIHPGAPDICDPEMLDQDCDGTPNNPAGGCSCVGGQTRACVLGGRCAAGVEMCISGTFGACSIMPIAETCNGEDDNCDGQADEGLTVQCFLDLDNDTYAAPGATSQNECPVAGREAVGGCPIGLTNRLPIGLATDCADDDPRQSPDGAEDRCDGRDQDCDGLVDEGLLIVCYDDMDGDGYAPVGAGAEEVCEFAGGCPPGGTMRAPTVGQSDCDDDWQAASPVGVEVCDTAMRDEDCDGTPNPPTLCSCSGTEMRACPELGACAAGTQTCSAGTWGACSVLATAESCNSEDDDCDGATDEGMGIGSRCYRDVDGDGYAAVGAAEELFCACPADWTTEAPLSGSIDCDDTSDEVAPGLAEACDRIDSDCSSGGGIAVDEDGDNDGYGPPGHACVGGPIPLTDCDDADGGVSPGTSELCDRVDSDCSSGGGVAADEDEDEDGYAPVGHVCVGGPLPPTDCDDTRAATSPDGTEICNGHDDDCSTAIDDGGVCPFQCTGHAFEGRGYMHCEPHVTWMDARDDCTAAGLDYLVQIDDPTENAFVATLCVNRTCFIGANDLAATGEWRWIDGSQFWQGGSDGAPVGGLYANWRFSHPEADEHCAFLAADGNWFSENCNQVTHFVCEGP